MADSEYSNLAVAQFTAIQKIHTQRNTADSPSIAYILYIPFKIFLWLSVLLPHNYLLNFILYFHILS